MRMQQSYRSLLSAGIASVFSLLLATGCMPQQTPHRNLTANQIRASYPYMIHSVASTEGEFTLEKPLFESAPPQPYQSIPCPLYYICPTAKGIPEGQYYLFCPNYGCPKSPEQIFEMVVDKKGDLVVNMGSFVSVHCPEVFAVQGFSSDWFLISKDGLSVYHAESVYKPLIATNSKGQSLEIKKKEIGGNFVEVVLKGFSPKEKVLLHLQGEDFAEKIFCKTSSKGSFSYFFTIPSQLKKGNLVATLSKIEEPLKVSSIWNKQTLKIKREQRTSPLHQVLQKLLGTVPEWSALVDAENRPEGEKSEQEGILFSKDCTDDSQT